MNETPRIFEVRGRFDPEEDTVHVRLRRVERADRDGIIAWSKWEPVELEPSLSHRAHSPTGFSWGYSGSGPSQLALAILLAGTGDARFAVGHYQAFKFESIAKLEWPEPWQLRVDVDEWEYESSRIVSGASIDTPGIELVPVE